jgi:hypothetical protein
MPIQNETEKTQKNERKGNRYEKEAQACKKERRSTGKEEELTLINTQRQCGPRVLYVT